ncbi:MAG: glycogen debranching enzyme N-terminal domain-containing protein [Chloroflexota bacterium]|nr:glycogen debranching enzyme N-terminal domain-containing protein [Chloroflexota bacterium]
MTASIRAAADGSVQLRLPDETCRDWSQASAHEWLVTNGRGSYASGTVAGTNTRRYHGLLVAALHPPLGRTLLVAALDTTVEPVAGTSPTPLHVHEYHDGTVAPHGHRHIEAFALHDGIPTWTYGFAGGRLTRTVWMEHGRDITYVRYALAPESDPIVLRLAPLCTFRDYHTLTQGHPDWRFIVEPHEESVTLRAWPEAPPYWLWLDRPAHFTRREEWSWRFLYRVERDRGLDHLEDLYVPGDFAVTLAPGKTVTVVLTNESAAAASAAAGDRAALARARARARLLPRQAGINATADPVAAALCLAADQCLVARGSPAAASTAGTILAGYPWFADWGRDTMIALPGLTLATGRIREAEAILRVFADHVQDGLLPNRFPDEGDIPEYNTADATLWYFHAIARVLAHSDDAASGALDRERLLTDLYPVLRRIVTRHLRGTRHHIHVDPDDGLLYAGEPGVQLTWMDAKVGDWVVTPRIGKPVEINALWLHALNRMAEWAIALGATDDATEYHRWLSQGAASFAARFWYAAGGFLYDVVDGPEGDDGSLRPNQVIATALPETPLSADQRRRVVEIVTEHLLTPMGLRSLAPGDDHYRGSYTGDVWQRDGAYHQGTVWPWLIGPFIDSHLAVYGDRVRARRLLEPLAAHLGTAGLGSVSEIFDGDPPHTPGGCYAQAWSVAELLRSWLLTGRGAG